MIYTKDNLIGANVPFDGKYLFLDIETANSYNDPCQIGAIYCENGKITKTICELIKPQFEFANFNIKIHKITPEMVEDKPNFRIIWEQYFSFVNQDTIIVGHNIKGDVDEITSCLHNLGLDIPTLQYLDTYDIIQRCFTKEYIECNVKLKTKNGKPIEHYRLKTMAKLFGFPAPNHNALIDCITEINLFSYLYTEKRNELDFGCGQSYSYIGKNIPITTPQDRLAKAQIKNTYREISKKLNEFLDLLYDCIPHKEYGIVGEPISELQDWFDENAYLIGELNIYIHQRINAIIDDGQITEDEFNEIEKQIYDYLGKEKIKLTK